jgi:hypothetical protein
VTERGRVGPGCCVLCDFFFSFLFLKIGKRRIWLGWFCIACRNLTHANYLFRRLQSRLRHYVCLSPSVTAVCPECGVLTVVKRSSALRLYNLAGIFASDSRTQRTWLKEQSCLRWNVFVCVEAYLILIIRVIPCDNGLTVRRDQNVGCTLPAYW